MMLSTIWSIDISTANKIRSHLDEANTFHGTSSATANDVLSAPNLHIKHERSRLRVQQAPYHHKL
jgi:hypothetical protein